MKKLTALLKQHYKKIGTVLMLAALVIVAVRLVRMDIDWAFITAPRTLLVLGSCVLLQAAVILFSALPWGRWVQMLTGRTLLLRRTVPVFAKSNLMKYVPGNVFQYVGRNALAAQEGLSHVDVALATVLDVGCTLLFPFLIAVGLMGSAAEELLLQYGRRLLLIGCAGIALCALLLGLLWRFGRRWLIDYMQKLRRLLTRQRLPGVLLTLGLYLLQNLVTLLLNALPALLVFRIGGELLPLFLGTYLFSWIIGFVTPGAPGGIGVREAVMMLVCGSFLGIDEVVLYAVFMRLVSVFGDVLAFAAGAVLEINHGQEQQSA